MELRASRGSERGVLNQPVDRFVYSYTSRSNTVVVVVYSVSLQQCSKESIHQLVLNAENLVREEVFLQQKIQQQQQLTLSRRHHSHPQQTYYQRQFSSPVLTTPPSAKCNGGSNSNHHLQPVAPAAQQQQQQNHHTMKANSGEPAKKSGSVNQSNSSSSSRNCGRKCDQLKIKLVQVRLSAYSTLSSGITAQTNSFWFFFRFNSLQWNLLRLDLMILPFPFVLANE